MKYTNGNKTDSTTVIYRPMECMNCSDVQRENTQLKELNREMVELLKELPNNMMQSGSPFCPYCHQSIIRAHDEDCNYTKVLAKAGGES